MLLLEHVTRDDELTESIVDVNGLSVVTRPKMAVDLPTGKSLPPKASSGKPIVGVETANVLIGELERSGKTAITPGVK